MMARIGARQPAVSACRRSRPGPPAGMAGAIINLQGGRQR
ncbi:hypothetical protein A3768_1550 [Ralstonia solanacearum]|nr:hypothetical protein A3768_1550 [Ralstonia solanacearum]